VAPFSRRKLLIGTVVLAGGGLALSWLRPGRERIPALAAPGSLSPNAWLQITPEGDIVLQVDKTELGQGVMTGFATLLAEELDIQPTQITLRFAPIDPLFQDPLQLTGESKSMRSRWLPIRETGARARQMLLQAAALRWQTDVNTLDTDGAAAVIDPRTGQRLSYAELATEAAHLPVPDEVSLKPAARWRWIGTTVPRPDIQPKISGRAAYGVDTRLPGLLVAVIARPPRLLAQPLRHAATAARAMPGVIDVLPIHTGIAVLGESFWHAQQGAAALSVEWDNGPLAGVSSASIRAEQGKRLDAGDAHRVRDDGDTDQVMQSAARIAEAEYWLPYLAHATLEPMNATIWFHDDGCEAWVPSQGPDMVRQVICDMSGLTHDQVKVHSTYAGGGFGRRATMEFVVEAVEIARRATHPVKLMWTRADDMRHGLYREATLHRVRAALGADGEPLAWQHRLVAANLNRLVIPIALAVLSPEWVPETAVSGVSSGVIGLLDRFTGSESARAGATSMPYAIPNVQIDLADWNPGVPVTLWRSVGHSYTSFVIESFIDELAAVAGQEPAAFRRKYLAAQPRHLAVLDLVLAKSGWATPVPNRHRGLAIQEAFGTIVAEVAEISIAPDNSIRVHRVSCAVDCGLAVNPDIVRQQMEGGILFGLSAALYGEIAIEDGAVQQSNFHDYRLLRLADSPAIDVHIIPSEAEPSGVGEPGVPPIAPAVANAVFAATGVRLRSLPLRL
jgi:isoquinoline 1-oxidoreductase/isoquinoline 1-oxidoreductase beta subunit